MRRDRESSHLARRPLDLRQESVYHALVEAKGKRFACLPISPIVWFQPAVLLSAIGLYGAISFAVSRRTKEIGIRIALGAESGGVVAMIVGQGMRIVFLGVLAGLGIAVFGVRLVRHLLVGSSQADAIFYAGAALLVVCIGLIACSVPARRAAGVEPLTALRHD